MRAGCLLPLLSYHGGGSSASQSSSRKPLTRLNSRVVGAEQIGRLLDLQRLAEFAGQPVAEGGFAGSGRSIQAESGAGALFQLCGDLREIGRGVEVGDVIEAGLDHLDGGFRGVRVRAGLWRTCATEYVASKSYPKEILHRARVALRVPGPTSQP